MIEEYYLTIQWGKGPHYFQGGPYTSKEYARKARKALRIKIPRRGALPTVRIMKVVSELRLQRRKENEYACSLSENGNNSKRGISIFNE